jgi:sec-independent protein translocase protein TatA
MGIDNPLHIAFLLVLLLLVFGAKRLPEMGRSMGSGLRGFKEALGGESVQPLLSTQQHGPIATTSADATTPFAPAATPAPAQPTAPAVPVSPATSSVVAATDEPTTPAA